MFIDVFVEEVCGLYVLVLVCLIYVIVFFSGCMVLVVYV